MFRGGATEEAEAEKEEEEEEEEASAEASHRASRAVRKAHANLVSCSIVSGSSPLSLRNEGANTMARLVGPIRVCA